MSTATTQPEPLQLADLLDSGRHLVLVERKNAASELRRLHAENEQLRVDLEAIDAGGVWSLIPATVQHQIKLSRNNDLQRESGHSSTSRSTAPQPLTDEQWLKRWTGRTGQRLKPGPERERLLRMFRFAERAHGIGTTAAAPQQHRSSIQIHHLTDSDIDAIADAMPGGLQGFMEGWGWQQFARAVLDAAQQPPVVEQQKTIPASAYDRLQALCDSQAARIMELEQPQGEQEPVAWRWVGRKGWVEYGPSEHDLFTCEPLYTHPQSLNCKSTQARLATLWGYVKAEQQPPRQPLTVEQIDGIIRELDPPWLVTPAGFEEEFCRAIERAHEIGDEK